MRKCLLILLDVLILGSAASFLCFYNLGEVSFGSRDETIYVLAAQELFSKGNWFNPTFDGLPFFFKPPLKLWLSQIPLAISGESNASYRMIDAACGVATILTTYFFGLMILGSRLTGFIAAFLLMTCSSYILNHGPRASLMDSLLLFLSTAALFFAGRYFLKDSTKRTHQTILASSVGILTGLAILTKMAAGLMPLFIIATFVILSGKTRVVLSEHKKNLGLVIFFALLVPSFYVVPHSLFTPGAYDLMIREEVLERATKGFHNTNKPLFYLERIFIDRAAVPPELLVLAIGYLLTLLMSAESRAKASFLLSWSVIPVILYSIAQSRLTWYIAPAFPGMALLIGCFMTWVYYKLVESLGNPFYPTIWERLKRLSSFALLTYSLFLIAYNFQTLVKTISVPGERIPLDLAAHSVLANDNHGVMPEGFIDPAWREKPYYKMIEKNFSHPIGSKMSESHFTLAKLDSLPSLYDSEVPKHYILLPPISERKHWWFIATKDELDHNHHLEPAKTLVDFGARDFEPLYGWRSAGSFHDLEIRWSQGERSAFTIEADEVYRALPSTWLLNASAGDSKGSGNLTVTVYLNGSELSTLILTPGKIVTKGFLAKPKQFQVGKNVIEFRYSFADGREISPEERLLMANWISIRLGEKALR